MKKKSLLKMLQKEGENEWKKFCLRRDGYCCQVQKHFPIYQLTHTNIYQVDHCITRACKETFLDVSNGTVVCSACNMMKSMGGIQNQLIDMIVRKREGEAIYQRLIEQGANRSPCLWWKSIDEMQKKVDILKSLNREMENLETWS